MRNEEELSVVDAAPVPSRIAIVAADVPDAAPPVLSNPVPAAIAADPVCEAKWPTPLVHDEEEEPGKAILPTRHLLSLFRPQPISESTDIEETNAALGKVMGLVATQLRLFPEPCERITMMKLLAKAFERNNSPQGGFTFR